MKINASYELQLNSIHEHVVLSQSGNGNREQQSLNTHAYPCLETRVDNLQTIAVACVKKCLINTKFDISCVVRSKFWSESSSGLILCVYEK